MSTATNVLLVGNPGAGKSFLLNSLGGTFPTGFSTVRGLTKASTFCDVNIGGSNIRLWDVPGLLDAKDKIIAHNAKEITNALRASGVFKLIFVLAQMGGRVRREDLYMVGEVMAAIEYSIDVGLIINKVPNDHWEHYNMNKNIDLLLHDYNSVARGKIKCDWFMPILDYRENNFRGPRTRMVELLGRMTAQAIPKVKPIKAKIKYLDFFLTFIVTVGEIVGDLWAQFRQAYRRHGVRESQEKPIPEGAAHNAEVAKNYEQPSKWKLSARLMGTTTAATAGANHNYHSDERKDASLTQRQSKHTSEQQFNCTTAPLPEIHQYTSIYIEELVYIE
ncbi:hypothetical protein DFQ26_000788 [Actinomortierella ambigua]|nr:hypothetical protein DFQ26_000788 [Actinomortierella ambigua]